MELELEKCAGGYRRDVLVDAADRVDGAWVPEDGILHADNEDVVWNVWRALHSIEGDARDAGVTSVAVAAEEIAEELEEMFSED